MPEYAVIAGKGNLPKLVIAELDNPKIICFEGEYEDDLQPHLVTRFGRIGQVMDFLREHEVKKVIFAGSMHRPDLKSLVPDAEGAKLMAKFMANSFFGKALGDDKLLSTITSYLHDKGFTVVGADEILGNLKTPKGTLTKISPSEEQMKDIRTGFAALKKLGELDIGQAAVVENRIVIAVEAVEGTEKMIERAGSLKKSYGGVLVKCKKPDQDKKVDLPAIGVDTIRQVTAAGISGIAIEAGSSLLIDKEALIAKADEAGVFVIGI